MFFSWSIHIITGYICFLCDYLYWVWLLFRYYIIIYAILIDLSIPIDFCLCHICLQNIFVWVILLFWIISINKQFSFFTSFVSICDLIHPHARRFLMFLFCISIHWNRTCSIHSMYWNMFTFLYFVWMPHWFVFLSFLKTTCCTLTHFYAFILLLQLVLLKTSFFIN